MPRSPCGLRVLTHAEGNPIKSFSRGQKDLEPGGGTKFGPFAVHRTRGLSHAADAGRPHVTKIHAPEAPTEMRRERLPPKESNEYGDSFKRVSPTPQKDLLGLQMAFLPLQKVEQLLLIRVEDCSWEPVLPCRTHHIFFEADVSLCFALR